MSRWARVDDLFHAVLARPVSERDAFLTRECAGDAGLRAEVESLVAAHDPNTMTGSTADLAIGTRLGGYELIGVLGAGGMGVVYRARDLKLGRDVAIKLLPSSVAGEPERVSRFEREARLLASLNHPNIAAIYGTVDEGPVRGLVLELVEGPTLADRIARAKIPLGEALPIAKQIAEALEAAHQQGIIHRDLKPANIKVRSDGTVKVLDFGLAKLAEAGSGARDPGSGGGASMSPTLTSPTPARTAAHVLLDTPAYMSPEQARGETVDKRTDIWAFGCVLFEMLTGRKAFDGTSVTEVIAKVLEREPDLTVVSSEVPSQVHTLLRRCLQKDRGRRLADMADAQLEMDDALAARAQGPKHSSPTAARPMMLVLGAAVVAAAVVGAAATWALMRRTPAAPSPPLRFAIVPPPGQSLDARAGGQKAVVSPDGRHIVYVGGTDGPVETQTVMVRAIDQLDAVALRGTEGASQVFMSPDGRWIGFLTRTELKKVSLAGGTPITLSNAVSGSGGGSWGTDDTIVYAHNGGLLRVSAMGGEATVLTSIPGGAGERHLYPSLLPGETAVLFTVVRDDQPQDPEVVALDLASGNRKTIVHAGQARYVGSGRLVYADRGTLRAVRFDPERLEVTGDSVTLAEGILPSAATATFSVSDQGTLAYLPDETPAGNLRSLVWIDRQGHQEAIKAPRRTYGVARISPDGSRIVVDIRDQSNDLWMLDVARETFARFTFEPGIERNPMWTPDGRHVVFNSVQSQAASVRWQLADGTGMAEELVVDSGFPKDVSPDGANVVLTAANPTTGGDIDWLSLADRPSVRRLLQSPASEGNPDLSPDGHWLAFASNESGRNEIYVRPFPEVNAGRWQVSTDGGNEPLWSHNGRELFYLRDGMLIGVPVQTSPTFRWGSPTLQLDVRRFPVSPGRRYDLSPDDRRFLFLKPETESGQAPTSGSIVVVLNWGDELNRLLPPQ